MQLSIIISILPIFISNVCALSPSNTDIQAISKRRNRIEQKRFPTTMDELQAKLGILTLKSYEFDLYWGQREEPPIAGKESYPSYKYSGQYGGDTSAIIKAIWTTTVYNPRTEIEVIQEAYYLKTSPSTTLLAFGINEKPSAKSPNYIFIIKDRYLRFEVLWQYISPDHAQAREKAKALRAIAKQKLKLRYLPAPSFIGQGSFLYMWNEEGKINAIFI